MQNVKKSNNRRLILFIWRWLLALILASVLLLNVFTHVFQVVNYNGTGMEPELTGGQTLILLKSQKVEQGDVIAFYYNNQVLVRRVICTGGSQLEIDSSGAVTVNGTLLAEPYVTAPTMGQCSITFPYYIHTDAVFVMGDNRETAMDSRLEEIGAVPTDRIIGKVILTF